MAAVPLVFELPVDDALMRLAGIVLVAASLSYLALVPICLAATVLLRRFGLLRRAPMYLAALLLAVVAGLLISLRWIALGAPERAVPAGFLFAAALGMASMPLIEVWLVFAKRMSKPEQAR